MQVSFSPLAPPLSPAPPPVCMCTHAGLPSDHALPDDAECLAFIQRYADSQPDFFNDFSTAYVKMCATGATWV